MFTNEVRNRKILLEFYMFTKVNIVDVYMQQKSSIFACYDLLQTLRV
ncbi:hypothetical protein [Methanobacterium bryantii]|nr:hypothetical protein [Methanobacterium bryantii]